MIFHVQRNYNNVAHHMALIVATEQVEGSWNPDSIDDVLQSINMSEKHNELFPIYENEL